MIAHKTIKKRLISFAAFIVAVFAVASTGYAEGSRNLIESANGQGFRPYIYPWDLVSSTDYMFSRQLSYKAEFKVYAKEGETIYLGSSYIIDGAIELITPSGESLVFDVTSDLGVINSLSTERNGPNGVILKGNTEPTTEGYTPVSYTVAETGEYVVHFNTKVDGTYPANTTAPYFNSFGKGYDGKVTEEFFQYEKYYTYNGTLAHSPIAAWDITVADANNNEIPGRVYSDYITFRNECATYQSLYMMTTDGYIYKMTLDGVNGLTSVFYNNARGLISTKNNMPLYHSIFSAESLNEGGSIEEEATWNLTDLNGNIDGARIDSSDNSTLNNWGKVFYTMPSDDLPESIRPQRKVNGGVTNFRFVGNIDGEDTEGIAYVGQGGNFEFDCDSASSYHVVLDMSGLYYEKVTEDGKIDTSGNFVFKNSDGQYINVSDRIVNPDITDETVASYYNCGTVLLGNTAQEGHNSVRWDGRDNNGYILPAGNYFDNGLASVTVTSIVGETHFVAADIEWYNNGIRFELMNPLDESLTTSERSMIYYNNLNSNVYRNDEYWTLGDKKDYSINGLDTSVEGGNADYIPDYGIPAVNNNNPTDEIPEIIWPNDRTIIDFWSYVPTTDENSAVLGKTVTLIDNETAASINGFVFYDKLADGSYAALDGDTALSGITVHCRYGNMELTTVTNSAGFYYFTIPTAADGVEYEIWIDTPESEYGYNSVTGTTKKVTGLAAGGNVRAGDIGIYEQKGSLSGTVWHDADGDGTLDSTETGIANVPVKITSVSDPSRTYSTVTDEKGGYSFADLHLDDYTVTSDYIGDSDSLICTNGSETKTVAVEYNNPGVADFGYVDIGRLTGTVWNDEDEDKTIDDAESMLQDITVKATLTTDPSRVYTGKTDSNGGYTIENLPVGTYTISVENTNNGKITVMPDSVIIEEAQTSTADVGLVWYGTLSVQVWHDVDADALLEKGEGLLSNISVTVRSQSDPLKTYTLTTDTDGKITQSLPVGEYDIITDSATISGKLAVCSTSNQTTTGAVAANTESKIYVGFYVQKGSVSGVIWNDADKDTDKDPSEQLLSNVTVTITDKTDPEKTYITTTDGNGRYSFSDLPAGDYEIKVTVPEIDGKDSTCTTGNIESTVTVEPNKDTVNDAGFYVPKGSISGTVWNDADKDMVFDGTESVVPTVAITITDNSTKEVVANILTNSDGGYSVSDLPVGSYHISVTAPTLEGVTALTTTNNTETDVTVTEGGNTVTDFGYYVPKGNIVGTIWNDTDKDKTIDTSEPNISGVKVTAVSKTDPEKVYETETVADGSYSFTSLPIGDYEITVIKPDIDGKETVCTTNNLITVVTVTEGNDTRNDVGVYVPKGSVSGTVWNDVDKDKIIDTEESGIGVVEITVTDNETHTVIQTIETDSTGKYSLTGLPIGSYHLSVKAPVIDGVTAKTTTNNVEIDVTVTEDNDTVTDFGYYIPKGSLSGIVWNDDDRDTAMDGGETTLAEVSVTVTSVSDPSKSQIVTTDTNGAYSVTGLPVGDYIISVTPVQIDGRDPVCSTNNITKTVTVTEDNDTVNNVGLYILKGTLSGTVWHDADKDKTIGGSEQVIPSVTVAITDNVTSRPVTTVETDSSGRYNVPDLPVGSYHISVTTPTIEGITAVSTTNNSEIDVVVAEDGNTVTDFGYYAPKGNIIGNVWNDQDKDKTADAGERVLSGVTVTATLTTDPQKKYTIQTDSDGNYQFNDLTVGEYEVVVTLPEIDGRESVCTTNNMVATIIVTEDKDAINNVGFYVPVGNIIGTVWNDVDHDRIHDDIESVIPEVTVTATDKLDASKIFTTKTDSSGMYSFTNLPTGEYELKVTAPLLEGIEPICTTNNLVADVIVTEDNTVTNDVGLYVPKGSISGTVWNDVDKSQLQDANELPIQGVTITVTDNESYSIIKVITTDESGRYTITGLPLGSYHISVATPEIEGYVSVSTTNNSETDIVVTEDNDTVTNFGYYVPKGSISGTVWNDIDKDTAIDDDEIKLSYIEMTIKSTSDPKKKYTVMTDNNGNYSVADLPVGEYEIRVSLALIDGKPPICTTNNMTVTVGVTEDKDTVNNVGLYVPKGSISGIVWNDADKDQIISDSEERIPNAEITITDNETGVVIVELECGSDGYYALADLPVGSYHLSVKTPVIDGITSKTTTNNVDIDIEVTEDNETVTNFGYYIPKGGISGMVWNDLDHDAQVDGNEAKLPNVTVTATSKRNPSDVYTLVTNITGDFTFEGLPIGDYIISVTKPSIDGREPICTTGNIDVTVTVTEDEYVVHDVGLYVPKGSISGTVWHDLDRNGSIDGSEPVLGAVNIVVTDNNTHEILDTITTDEMGKYSLSDLPTGSYHLSVSTPVIDGITAVNTTSNVEIDVDVTEDGNTVTDFGFCIHKGSLSGTVWNDADKDTVIGETEAKLTGVKVTVTSKSDSAKTYTLETDANGGFSCTDLPVGEYEIKVGTPYIDGKESVCTTGNIIGTVTVTDSNDTIHNVGFYLPVGSVCGTVWHDVNRDAIYDSGESVLSGITIKITDKKDSNVSYTTITDENGQYRFDNLPVGEYIVETSTPDIDGKTGICSTGNIQADVSVSDGYETVNDVGFYIEKGSISGTVWHDEDRDTDIDGNESGIGSVEIVVVDNSNHQEIVRLVTDADGHYSLADLPVGSYHLSVKEPMINGYNSSTTTHNIEIDVDVSAGNNTETDFGFCIATGSITGIVWHDVDDNTQYSEGETTLTQVWVCLKDVETGEIIERVQTDSDGRYEFSDVMPGRYIVETESPLIDAREPICTTNNSRVEVSVNDTTPTVVDVGYNVHPGTLECTIWFDEDRSGTMDEGEQLLGGAYIFVESQDKSEFMTEPAETNEGFVTFEGLDPGIYNVYVEFDDQPYQCTTNNETSVVEITGDETTSIFIGYYKEEVPEPTEEVTEEPTEEPTDEPTETPTKEPTETPTEAPTEVPTEKPSEEPTETPSEEPTDTPSPDPSESPSPESTETASPEPSESPSSEPTETASQEPSESPSSEPTETASQEPSESPSPEPTETASPEPSETPIEEPTEQPSEEPTQEPSKTLYIIEGIVWEDTDSDQDIDDTEDRFVDISVTLVNKSDPEKTYTAATNELGEYKFEVEAGEYDIEFEMPSRTGYRFSCTTDNMTGDILVEDNVQYDVGYRGTRRSSGGGGSSRPISTTPTIEPTATPEPSEEPTEAPETPELNTDEHFAYIIGYPDGSVQPEGTITREEVATIFFRLLTDESRNRYWSQNNPYPDVAADRWSNNAISTMTNAGIVSGYHDGTFMPERPITRAEFAAVAARFDSDTYDGEDMFSDIHGHWASDSINRAVQKGWIKGYEDGTFRPDEYITRAEAMTLINRMLDREVDADAIANDAVFWPDNDPNAWYYTAVEEATNSHDYTVDEHDEEQWTEVNEPRDWALLEQEWSDANSAGSEDDIY